MTNFDRLFEEFRWHLNDEPGNPVKGRMGMLKKVRRFMMAYKVACLSVTISLVVYTASMALHAIEGQGAQWWALALAGVSMAARFIFRALAAKGLAKLKSIKNEKV